MSWLLVTALLNLTILPLQGMAAGVPGRDWTQSAICTSHGSIDPAPHGEKGQVPKDAACSFCMLHCSGALPTSPTAMERFAAWHAARYPAASGIEGLPRLRFVDGPPSHAPPSA